MQLGFTVPGMAPDVSPSTVVEFATRAEAAGAHSVWVTDRITDRTPDPFVMLGAITALTTRVRIGTSVLLGSLRPPALVAKAAGSIDWLSRGRLILGLGVGSRAADFEATGVPIRERGRRMDELVTVLNKAPKRPPLWFGGRADAVLRRVATVGDGYIGSTSSGVAGFSAAWSTIQRYAAEAGRDPSTITPAALIHFSLNSDRERAQAAMREYLTQSYGPERAKDLGNMVGTADDLRRGLDEYAAAGVQVLILSSITADVGHLERFCDEVASHAPAY